MTKGFIKPGRRSWVAFFRRDGHLFSEQEAQELRDARYFVPTPCVPVRLAALIDKNGDGVIDYLEFLPVCFSMIVEILSDKVRV